MIYYFFKRTGYSLVVLFGVVSLVFILFSIIPGDPARMMLGQRSDEESLKAIKKDLGLDKPKYLQYLKYLNDLSPLSWHTKNANSFFYFDKEIYSTSTQVFQTNKYTLVLKTPYLRRSYQSKKPVLNILTETLPNTFVLALSAIILAALGGIILGILSALKKDSWFDRSALIFSALGMSVPSFFAAILIGWLFAFFLGEYTGLNLTGNLFVVDDFGEGRHFEIANLILPAFTLGIRPLSVIMQLTRGSLLEVMGQDYIRTARAKGLTTRQVIVKHALQNALNPVVTSISGWFASLMAGVVFIEYIFGWKGTGFVIVQALNTYDLPVVIGCVLTISVIFVLINMLVDILYALLDPRVRLE